MRPKINWTIYWVGIAFIVLCLGIWLSHAKAEEDPCQWEKDNATQVCRALGRKSNECKAAIDKVKLCRAAEGGDDPLEGLHTPICRTECIPTPWGTLQCRRICDGWPR